MIENKLHFFFKNQIWHIGGLILLFYVSCQMVDFENDSNVFLGISSKNWFLFAMTTPLLLTELWVNYQYQTDFNPFHFHGGVYSWP